MFGLLTAFSAPSFAADLYRLRFQEPVPVLVPGGQTTATVVLDHDDYPFGGGSQRVRAFSFGVTVKAPLEFISASFDGTIISETLMGQSAFFEIVQEVNGGIVVGFVLDVTETLWIPDGLSQSLMHLDLSTPGATADQTVPMTYSAELGDPPVEILFVAEEGDVIPHTRGTTITIQAPQGAAPPPGSGGTPPGPIPQPAPPDPSLFPAPTEQELWVQWYEASPPVVEGGFGGGAPPLGPGGGGPCDVVLPLGDPPTPDAFVEVGVNTLEDALAAYTGPGLYTIEILPGVHEASVIIDTSVFAQGITIYATTGPDDTVLEGAAGLPVFTVTTGTGGGGPVVIGWIGDDEDDLRGFTIRGGVAGVANPGAGISAGFDGAPLDVDISILGNKIGDESDPNEAFFSGGGVALNLLPPATAHLHRNEICFNTAGNAGTFLEVFGSGVFMATGRLELIANSIHDNVFESNDVADADRKGGGVAALVEGESTRATLCRNEIFDNNAVEGGGVYMSVDSGLDDPPATAHLESNDVHDNAYWLPSVPGTPLDPSSVGRGYRGAGIAVVSLDGVRRVIDIFNNEVRLNTIDVPSVPAYSVGTEPTEVGGGVYISVVLSGLDTDFNRLRFVGNFVHQNFADNRGAGLFVAIQDVLDVGAEGLIHNNTLTQNELLMVAPEGAGIYLAAAVPPLAATGTAFDASCNIVKDNVPMAVDWFCELPWDPQSEPFRFSQMDDLAPVGSCDLFNGVFEDTTSPQLRSAVNPHIGSFESPCVDRGDPLLTAAVLGIDIDIDGEDREFDILGVPAGLPETDILDRGADEYYVRFVRGDANGDGSFQGLVDGLFLLNWQFVPGSPAPPCDDAADADDNGSVNGLVDGLYILNYQFVSGSPPPPAPFPSCGLDPTPDGLPLCNTGIPGC